MHIDFKLWLLIGISGSLQVAGNTSEYAPFYGFATLGGVLGAMLCFGLRRLQKRSQAHNDRETLQAAMGIILSLLVSPLVFRFTSFPLDPPVILAVSAGIAAVGVGILQRCAPLLEQAAENYARKRLGVKREKDDADD